jgi:hypothetical protein
MKKIAVLASALAMVATGAPALAEGSTLTNIALAPVKVVGLATGAVVGTPIAVTRYVAKESVASTKKIAGDSGNPALLAAAGLIGVPIGVFVGGVEGVYYGSANAYSKPFGKDSFSLGEIE